MDTGFGGVDFDDDAPHFDSKKRHFDNIPPMPYDRVEDIG